MLKKVIIIVCSLLVIFSVCFINAKYINTKQIQVRQVVIETDKFEENDESLLIAYFSDLHYGIYIDNNLLKQAIAKINSYNPDVVVFGGDLLECNTSIDNKTYLVEQLKSIHAKYGKYAVLGECDIVDINTKNMTTEILKEADFSVLENTNTVINLNKKTYLNLIGINSISDTTSDVLDAFYGVNANNYTLVISHYPDTFEMISECDFDYMLAGHSHGGQIYLPIINLLSRKQGCKKYYRGKHKKDNEILDITNGLGLSNYDARFMADSEIVLYRLDSK